MKIRINLDINEGNVVYADRALEDILANITALKFKAALIDLDATYGRGSNTKLISRALEQHPALILGGGVKSLEDVKKYADLGAQKIIVGSILINNEGWNSYLIEEIIQADLLSKVILSLDYSHDDIVINGFKTKTSFKISSVLQEISDLYERSVTVQLTDADASRYQTPVNFEKLWQLKRTFDGDLWYAGNIKTKDDVYELGKIGMGAVIGRHFIQNPSEFMV